MPWCLVDLIILCQFNQFSSFFTFMFSLVIRKNVLFKLLPFQALKDFSDTAEAEVRSLMQYFRDMQYFRSLKWWVTFLVTCYGHAVFYPVLVKLYIYIYAYKYMKNSKISRNVNLHSFSTSETQWKYQLKELINLYVETVHIWCRKFSYKLWY